MTIKVTTLTALNNGTEICVCIDISNGENTDRQQLTLLTEQYASLHIQKGEISRERFDEIAYATTVCSAYKKGLFLLGYGACSEKKLHYKLRSKGFENDICAEAVAMLLSKGYINEDNDSLRETERCLAKLWGKKRIISHLYSKGYTQNAVRTALEALEDIDFNENCRKLILRDHKKQFYIARTDKSEMTKLVSSLVRMGYSFSEIKEASAMIAADSADEI